MSRDEAFTVASWTSRPYTGIRRRGDAVEHRVRAIVYDGGHADVVHEVRHVPAAGSPDDWIEERTVEIRDHGATMYRTEVPYLT